MKFAILGFLILAFLFLLVGAAWPFEVVVHLAIGWFTHATHVLPQVTVSASGIGMLTVCLVLAFVIGHRLSAWLWKATGHEAPWQPRWTASGLGVVVLMFAAGMCFTAVAHQTGWLLRKPEALVEANSIASSERNASSLIKTIWHAQMDFASFDRDGNGVKDYWRKDIAGLYAAKRVQGEPLKLIPLALAAADSHPIESIEQFTVRSARMGYWFKALRFRGETTADPTRFAALAFPDSRSAGFYCFIVSDQGVVFRKSTSAGPLPEVYPDSPEAEGWAKLD